MHERALGAGAAGGLEQVQRADGVRVEVVERDGRRPVVRGLRGRVDDRRRPQRLDQGQDAGPVADVELVVHEAGHVALEAGLVPARVARGSEEDGALVVVDAVHLVALGREVGAHLAPDQARTSR